MAPIRTYTNWISRPSDNTEQIEPYRKYYFICEGANTETWYFQSLIDLRKELGIQSSIEVILLEKTGVDANLSNPEQLIAFADIQKNQIDFDAEIDKMVVVFDADVFESTLTRYNDIVTKGEEQNVIAVTNPGFELFLLLHIQDSLDRVILPHEAEIIANEKVGSQRFICRLFSDTTGKNSKKNPSIGELAVNIKTAIAQEQGINQDIHNCKGKLTSNIGKIIASIMENADIS